MKLFNQTQKPKIKRTAFDLTHEKKLTGKMGQLIPILCQETLPGDKWQIDTQSLIRLAPMLAPVYHRMDAYIHFFYVPNRIIWSQWQQFASGDTSISLPTYPLGNIAKGSLGDYLGLPIGDWTQGTYIEHVSALPLYAYYSIYNEYYRDENLINKVDPILNNYSSKPLTRAWEKDYFTSALPWAQKGQPVKMNMEIDYANVTAFQNFGGSAPSGSASFMSIDGSVSKMVDQAHPSDAVRVMNLDGILMDINDLRKASALQRWLEKNARSGNRYVEYLLAHWGVHSKDASLQRPEYIGGGKTPITVSEVLNMTASDGSHQPVGDMYGHGISVGTTNLATKYTEEHGYIMGIMSIIPKGGYSQGINRSWSRKSITDFYDPDFAHLGEQEVLSKELYFNNDSDQETNDSTFGYQSRFAEYKYCPNTSHGEFNDTLKFWHLNREFATRPLLNSSFINCQPSKRIFAIEDPAQDELWIQLLHRITSVRPIPYFSTPGIHII